MQIRNHSPQYNIHDEAIPPELIESAKAGNPVYQHALAERYHKRGGDEDKQKFHKWMLRAAKQNHLQAMARMGDAYTHGLGTERDYKRAAAYYLKAANRGHIATQYFVGKLYMEGKGVVQDATKAAKWLSLATDLVRKEGTPKALQTRPVSAQRLNPYFIPLPLLNRHRPTPELSRDGGGRAWQTTCVQRSSC